MGVAPRSIRLVATGTLLATAFLTIAGCLYIPTPSGATLAGREVMEEDLAFLQPGVTSKEDVETRLGNPTFLWRDENVLIYRWVEREGVMLWAIAGHYNAAFGATDISKEVAFLVKFDADDRYVNSEIRDKPPMKSFGDFLLEWRDSQKTRDLQLGKETP